MRGIHVIHPIGFIWQVSAQLRRPGAAIRYVRSTSKPVKLMSFDPQKLAKTIVLREKCNCISPFAMAKGRPFQGKTPTGRLNSMSGQTARIRRIIAGG